MIQASGFSHRLATMADLPELKALMAMAIRELVGAYLDAARVEASFEIMGVDTQLIEDGTSLLSKTTYDDGPSGGVGYW
jgi:hypothetical protein